MERFESTGGLAKKIGSTTLTRSATSRQYGQRGRKTSPTSFRRSPKGRSAVGTRTLEAREPIEYAVPTIRKSTPLDFEGVSDRIDSASGSNSAVECQLDVAGSIPVSRSVH